MAVEMFRSLTLKEKHGLRVLENRVPGIVGLKKAEVMACIKLHKEF
jgi:hypothetical protein